MQLKVKRVGDVAVPLPAYQTKGAAGLDLHAAIPGRITLEPGGRRLIPTGYAVALPPGHEGHVRPRSGLALNHGITVLNSPGTIDGDYRGEIGVVIINHSHEAFVVEPGTRIAQLIVSPVTRVEIELADELDVTERGEGGYGSTG
jgi:dUTP pyrophosphatase